VLAVGVALVGALAAVPPASAVSAASAPAVPPDFLAQSTTWLSKDAGFLLGSASCGDATCNEVLGTTDGGASWHRLGRVHALITRDGLKRSGVGEIRFGDADHGWAFAPLLRHTSDGGKTWTVETIPGDQGQVLDLATDAEGSWAIVSPCAWQHFGACRKKPLTLWRTTTATGSTWTQVDATLPYSFQADVSAFGTSVYVSDSQLQFGSDDILLASMDGVDFTPRTAPCDHAQNIALIQVVARSATDASLLCDGDPGFSKAVKIVYNTDDNGLTFRNRGMTGLLGIQAQLAASPSGNLAVAAWSDGSFIYVNDSRSKTWDMPVGLGDGGLGWNDIVYVTNKVAYIVYAPAGGVEPKGQLWMTRDAGRDWQDVSP
jgi:photosystem II stability/assembly factor-like uncharacterized protein